MCRKSSYYDGQDANASKFGVIRSELILQLTILCDRYIVDTCHLSSPHGNHIMPWNAWLLTINSLIFLLRERGLFIPNFGCR